jgi:2-polyprenyl-3-methyl-5-hydroxy-6-metoxy-1,4-benzoquinol methylase
MDDISDIQAMYNAAWDNEDDRLHRHQLEHDMTWRYLEKYLPPPGSSLLEVGAATGRYTLELASRGYQILAVDLAPELVARAGVRAKEAGLYDHTEFRVGDVRTLTNIRAEAYDGVLLMGPMYHLVLREDRLLALGNIYQSLKKEGVIFSSWISRFGIFGELIKSAPEIVRRTEVMLSVLERGRDPDWYRSRAGSFRGYFALASEIAPIHEEIGFQTLTLAGVEPAISADDASYNNLEGEQRRLWLDVLFRLSAEPSMVASSRHLLYVGKKGS